MNIKGRKVIIRPKKRADAENDYRWQTDAELSALDAMIPSTMSYQGVLSGISQLAETPLFGPYYVRCRYSRR